MQNLAVSLTDSACHYPEKTAVSCMGTSISYEDLDSISSQVANGLRASGIERGEKVAICCPNLPYFPMVYYGILKAGCAVVPLNVLLKRREMAYHMKDSDSVALFCFEGSPELPVAQEGAGAFSDVDECRHVWYLPATPGGNSPIEGGKTLAALIESQPDQFDTEQMDANDTAVILYTSGTTGLPKGAELTHSNMILNALVSNTLGHTTHEDTYLVVLPLFHSYGQTVMLNGGIQAGATLVLLPRFNAGDVLRLFQDEGVTMFAGVPTMYWEVLNYAGADEFDLDKIRENLRFCS
ncbi:MAG: AMP-binding protein, partial [Candidatus Hydrogenedentes bacterium]|nr:AMP-binding protein [Candidatus Hydrogenedentota bacterium]